MKGGRTAAGAVVRPAGTGDADTVLWLLNQLHPSVRVARERFMRVYHDVVSAPGHGCLVVAAGEVVGYASGYRHTALYAAAPVAYLDEIIVAAASRGRGYGALLLAGFEAWARAGGCVMVSLATAEAAGFYESRGYRSRAGHFRKVLSED